ncbi:MAG: hypothetical protein RSE04_06105 [Hydrogenoanaerobacterium sp.]
MKHIETWGYEINPNGKSVGFNGLICNDKDIIYIRTINAVALQLERARREVALFLKYDTINTEEAEKRNQVLNMVESTLNNNRKNLEDFDKWLKEDLTKEG